MNNVEQYGKYSVNGKTPCFVDSSNMYFQTWLHCGFLKIRKEILLFSSFLLETVGLFLTIFLFFFTSAHPQYFAVI